MTTIDLYSKVKKGSASLVTVDELVPSLKEGFGKFLRDGQKSYGDKWVEKAYDLVFGQIEKGQKGVEAFKGSNTYLGVAIATFCPEINLIGGKDSLELYKQAENKNPFGGVYFDFGVNINGNPETNLGQAEILLEEFKKRRKVLEEGRVPDLNQLRLFADEKAGLVYRLADGVKEANVAYVGDYPFYSVGKNGLFRACLGGVGNWSAYGGGLPSSDDCGRVVRFDAEGVVRKVFTPKPRDLVSELDW